MGTVSSAIKLYEKALAIKENDIIILFSLANAYHAIGDIKQTKKIISKILDLNPKHVSTHKLLSSIVNYSEDNANFNQMKNLISDYGGIKYTKKKINEFSSKAYDQLNIFADSKYKDLLVKTIEFNIDRKF